MIALTGKIFQELYYIAVVYYILIQQKYIYHFGEDEILLL